ncbi:uncharacterized protein DUF397 [Herbihabitans rhizosphaerae]|uniref:Uncharacterized protein DUF397 n=1 Tax=Herbihabitans rhizosphaerae TaxID=1872711 RepID=A0A4Q7KDA1_9PSEU|nr:DUF397 domain-containing protein [Herbihabitans rhizosphaerae]RZS31345.1 uncharacterized protein DUF397 [Herbihabitans rhizosphaerae]
MRGSLTANVKSGAGAWIRSSYSTPNNNCVEVRFGGDGVAVRDSKSASQSILTFDGCRWRDFVTHSGR